MFLQTLCRLPLKMNNKSLKGNKNLRNQNNVIPFPNRARQILIWNFNLNVAFRMIGISKTF